MAKTRARRRPPLEVWKFGGASLAGLRGVAKLSVMTLERRPMMAASSRAAVVLPEPGGPLRMINFMICSFLDRLPCP
jgi:hypothetical protein